MDSKRQKTDHIFEAPAYLSGAPVLLKGLQSRPELNGTEAIYEKQHKSPDTGNVRYDVKLSDGTVIRVKESCVDRAEFQCDFFVNVRHDATTHTDEANVATFAPNSTSPLYTPKDLKLGDDAVLYRGRQLTLKLDVDWYGGGPSLTLRWSRG